MTTSFLKRQFDSWAWAIGGLFLGLSLVGCTGGQDTEPSGKPKVVATNTILQDWTAEVAGDEVELVGILQPGADPHVYEPVPADNLRIEQADLIFYNGYNLEPGLIKLIESTQKSKVFAVGEVVTPLDFDYEGKREPDPHVWGDAKNAIKMVNAIRDQLIELSPEDKEEFTQNAAEFTKELAAVDQWIGQQMQTIPSQQRQLVTTHDAFQYYAKAYGLTVAGTLIGMSTEEQPSAQTVKRLSDDIEKAKVPAIFAETTINPALIKTVAAEAKVKLAEQELYSDSIGASGTEADTYIKMLQVNTRTIVEALGGNYTEFQAALSEEKK
ncbi:metal ABC transporter solute-binding protein, Zn/Mn family [Acaryochloris marina]|uniref:ABC transporter, periplasmic solute-binding protein n=1 Tax=Acaryochloris marina (strain MBIC 11017) TaxID=329726 RepID=B0C4P1_ACAM1|nr:zinc ABC transporter substrate-binding protein [Acaryochloris marina]ABW29924.1 ABC transporter, periplasmic solute-binding protein [Acaryochloris marina MBIC11017]BDM78799.1 manganese ABC transporter substrate-binding protein [Acaryochloris marina MBIC10699]